MTAEKVSKNKPLLAISTERVGKKRGRKSKEADVAGVFLRSFNKKRKDGSIYVYQGDIWQICFPTLCPDTGKTLFKHKSSGSKLKSEAERQLNDLKTAHYKALGGETEKAKPAGIMTLRDFVNNEYLCDPEVMELSGYDQVKQQAGEMIGGLDPRYVKITTRGKERVFNPKHLGNIKIKDITAERFKEYLRVKTDKGLAISTNNKHIALYQRMMNVAFMKKLVGYEAVVESKIVVKDEENNSRINSLTPELITLLLAEVEKKSLQHRQFMEFAFACGIRKNRVYALTWDMLDLVECELDIPKDKHGKRFQANLGATAIKVLTERLYDTRKDLPHRYVFVNPVTNTHWCDLKKAFNDAKAKAVAEAFKQKINTKGLVDFKFHDARHTFISSLVNAKVPFDQVQKLAGHLDARSTERYTHRDKPLMKEAVAKLPY